MMMMEEAASYLFNLTTHPHTAHGTPMKKEEEPEPGFILGKQEDTLLGCDYEVRGANGRMMMSSSDSRSHFIIALSFLRSSSLISQSHLALL